MAFLDQFFCFQNFIDTLGANQGTGSNHKHHCKHHEGRNNLHTVGHKYNHVTEQACEFHQRCGVDNVSTNPVDRKGDTVHDKRHQRIHKRHDSAGKQVGICKFFMHSLKLVLLELLCVISTNNTDAAQIFTSHLIQVISEDLQFFELLCYKKHNSSNTEKQDNYCDCYCQRPLPLFACNLGNGPHCGNRSLDYHLHPHSDQRLYLLHIVGRTGDQGGRAEFVNFTHGEALNFCIKRFSQSR